MYRETLKLDGLKCKLKWVYVIDFAKLASSIQEVAEHYLRVHSWFFSSVLFILLGWFERWEAGNCSAAVLRSAASRICSKQYVALLCSSHQAFSPSISQRPRGASIQLYWYCYSLEESLFDFIKVIRYHNDRYNP